MSWESVKRSSDFGRPNPGFPYLLLGRKGEFKPPVYDSHHIKQPADILRTRPKSRYAGAGNYGRAGKGVGMMLWVQWELARQENFPKRRHLCHWAIKGVKRSIFMGRNDQDMGSDFYFHRGDGGGPPAPGCWSTCTRPIPPTGT